MNHCAPRRLFIKLEHANYVCLQMSYAGKIVKPVECKKCGGFHLTK
jgi:hypothetical protein